MTTSATPLSPATAVRPDPVVRVVSHTGLVYWWPVWLVGFILSGLVFVSGGRLAVVPGGTTIKAVGDNVYELTVPGRSGAYLEHAAEATARGERAFPVRASGNREFGVIYIVVLLFVIFSSNVPLRGLWSVVAVLAVIVAVGALAYFDVWGWILDRLWGLHIEISLAGYLLTSVVLLALWCLTVFGLDQLRFVHFTTGQFTVCEGIGNARAVYDMTRVTVRKKRSDLIRHWILGLGAGDLVITVPNQSQEILMPDVLFVDRKIRQIAELMKVRPVTTG